MVISDLGLYGPESVTWRIHADPSFAVGGLRALLLQALHPVAMAGVSANSGYRDDPWGRLQRTTEYVAVTTFGTAAEAEEAASKVRRVHRRLTAVDPDSGEVYRVDDPSLLLWVHCCEVDSFLHAARRGGLRLSDAEADRYVAEQVRQARLIGLTDEVPRTTAELAAYFAEVRPLLRATGPAYEGLRLVSVPPMRWWVRWATPAAPSWGALVAMSFGLLPGWAKQLYTHLPVLPGSELTATASLRALRTAVLALPATVREGPHLKAARARVAGIPVRRLDSLPA
ncbi:oxygenase MpaB family protein [Cryptosporangium arvum]|uniref:oxygenase MpaB family protein n=1 Tax=Cryptosporangium arvum TaxID=80871 RepID=UPI0004B8A878|nr:oxygenase MpaB family protein [Cryptosporangium arvum]